MVRGLENHITDAEGNDAASMAVHGAHVGGVSFEDSLVDEAFVIFGVACSGIVCVDGRDIIDVVFGEVLGALDECWGWLAGHAECGIVVGVADGDMAEAVEDLVIVEDVVCCC